MEEPDDNVGPIEEGREIADAIARNVERQVGDIPGVTVPRMAAIIRIIARNLDTVAEEIET